MEKVRMWALAGKAVLLVRARSEYYMLYAVAFFVVSLFALLLSDGESESISMLSLINPLMSLVIFLSLYHFSLSSCRNRTSFYPQPSWSRTVRFFVSNLAVGGIGFVAMIIAMLPAIAYALANKESVISREYPEYLIVLGLVVLASLITIGVAARFGAVIPSSAIGDGLNLSESWKMTKSYGLKILCALVLFNLPALLFGIAWIFIIDMPEQGYGMPFELSVNAVSAVALVFTHVYFSLFYEELRSRLQAPLSDQDFSEDNSVA